LDHKLRKRKEKESFDRAPFAQAIAFDTTPNPIGWNINPFHDAIIEHKRVVTCRSTPESLGCREEEKKGSPATQSARYSKGARQIVGQEE
jgi:hypothetical protein